MKKIKKVKKKENDNNNNIIYFSFSLMLNTILIYIEFRTLSSNYKPITYIYFN